MAGQKPTLSTTVATVSGQTVRTQALTPIHTEQFTVESLKDPVRHVAQLTRLHKAIGDALRAVRSQTRTRAMTFQAVTVGVTISIGTAVKLNHGFGSTRVRWAVVWWSPTDGASAHNFQFNANSTNDTLYLTSLVAGTADIEVWPAV